MTKWKIDPIHSSIEFKVRHLGISWIKGFLNGIEGSIEFDENEMKSLTVDASVEVGSINTGNSMRDGHLKSADFFDVENFSSATVKSISVESIIDNSAKVKSLLTIKGVTKEVIFDFSYLGKQDKINRDGTTNTVVAFVATATIDRYDFGLSFNMDLPGGKQMIGKEIGLEVNIEALI